MTQKLFYEGTQSFTTFVSFDDHKILHHKFLIMYLEHSLSSCQLLNIMLMLDVVTFYDDAHTQDPMITWTKIRFF
jgi:hypothetical protein